MYEEIKNLLNRAKGLFRLLNKQRKFEKKKDAKIVYVYSNEYKF